MFLGISDGMLQNLAIVSINLASPHYDRYNIILKTF